jgi:5-methylthioribose kinase
VAAENKSLAPMLELTADNAVAYLRERGWPVAEPAWAEMLAGGVSNQVLRIWSGPKPLVLKQSRPQLRTREAWFSDLERIYREQEVMQALEPLLPAGAVPHVLFADRANFVYAMSHALLEARVWKAELLAGQIDLALGTEAGRVLGIMHEASTLNAERFAAFHDHQVYVQLRVEPFYRRIQERRPEVANALAGLIAEMLTRKEALCHGDYTPKNMLVHDRRFMLVDYETAHVGDPTMDLGLFLAHLTLKAVRLPARRADYVALMRAFWDAYRQEVRFESAAELERRGLLHLGACLLARVDGTSPVDYLPDEAQRETVRRLGRSILQEVRRRWEEAWTWGEDDR